MVFVLRNSISSDRHQQRPAAPKFQVGTAFVLKRAVLHAASQPHQSSVADTLLVSCTSQRKKDVY